MVTEPTGWLCRKTATTLAPPWQAALDQAPCSAHHDTSDRAAQVSLGVQPAESGQGLLAGRGSLGGCGRKAAAAPLLTDVACRGRVIWRCLCLLKGRAHHVQADVRCVVPRSRPCHAPSLLSCLASGICPPRRQLMPTAVPCNMQLSLRKGLGGTERRFSGSEPSFEGCC